MTPILSLQKKLEAFFIDFQAFCPPPFFKTLDTSIKKLQTRTESILRSGARAPLFSLYSMSGEYVNLSNLLAYGPLIISFYRGGWCPYCQLEMESWQEEMGKIEELGAKLIAISPELPANGLNTIKKLKITFQLLTDPGNTVAKSFGVYQNVNDDCREVYREMLNLELDQWNGPESGFGLPYPGTFIIDQSGIIRYAWADPDFSKRAEPEEVIAVLKEILQPTAVGKAC